MPFTEHQPAGTDRAQHVMLCPLTHRLQVKGPIKSLGFCMTLSYALLETVYFLRLVGASGDL